MRRAREPAARQRPQPNAKLVFGGKLSQHDRPRIFCYRKVNIPRQSRGRYLWSRSKRLFGVANAAPVEVSRLKAVKEFTGAATTVLTHLMISYFWRIEIFISM